MGTAPLRRFAPAWLVVVTILAATAPMPAVAPIWAPLPAATQVAISNGPGNQTDPHVSGAIAPFTADTAGGLAQIQYYDFQLGVVTGIANEGSIDLLSDVDGNTIVFTRISYGKQAIYAFDTTTQQATELDPMDSSRRRGAAIGGNTVAWIDLAAGSDGEIAVYDLATGGPAQLFTEDSLVDRRVAVSPDGNVIVWEKCADAAANCDIYQALKGASGWTVSPLTTTAEHESSPDTNGTIVVYGRRASSSGVESSDIHWMPVGGGLEQQLELAGREQNPNISGNLIVFEGQALSTSMFDLFAYDVSTNILYQVTNSPWLSETLNDVWVSPSGLTRIVWSVLEGSDENVYGTTFQLPGANVVDTIEELIALVESFNLHQGIENSLDVKLQNARLALDSKRNGDTATACSLLDAFKNEVVAQSGKALTADQAVELLLAADSVMRALGCF